MKLAIIVTVAVALLAVSLLLGTQAAGGSGVGVDARSSAPIATVGASPMVAPTAGLGISPTVGATPITPNLGNLGVAYDGSQRGMPFALYEAIVSAFPRTEVANAIAVASCETGRTWRSDLVSLDGAEGVFQIVPRFHGAVPIDYAGQAVQAARIQSENGWSVWSCRP